MNDNTPAAARPDTPQPWWRVPFMWLVVGGPALVVMAAIATAVIAINGADPQVRVAPIKAVAELPAMQGRNHAAAPR